MKNILFICNTTYQLIVALQLKVTEFKDFKADIIITDIIKNSEKISKRLEEIGIFNRVINIKIKDLNFVSNKLLKLDIYFKNKVLLRNSETNNFISTKYDICLFANLGGFSTRIGKYLSKINSSMELFMFEDGISSYSQIYGEVLTKKQNDIRFLEKLKSLIGVNIFKKVSRYYLFNPDFIVWECIYPIYKIPSISGNRHKLLSIFNRIFDYDKCRDSYKENILFFEESYFADGFKIDDVSIIKKISNKYGKGNLLIKLHPRNSINRFENLNIKISQEQEIPWEIIALNINLDNKILLTISSSAVVNTFVLLDSNIKMIFLYELLNIQNDRLIYTKEVIERIKKLYPKAFIIPSDINEIIN